MGHLRDLRHLRVTVANGSKKMLLNEAVPGEMTYAID